MTIAPRLLVLLGSGETAPAMRAMHASLLACVPAGAPRLLLETPYGFQANAPEMTAKVLEWFAVNVGSPLAAAGLPRLDSEDLLARQRGLAMAERAGYLLAGPGSPSFALRQWAGSPVPDRMRAMLREGGTLVLASAAALTAGARTLPVYEIYKAGEDPSWLHGLDLLSPYGISAAIVPHYDNAEGGGHDTRFCYMGEARMALLERMLPLGIGIIGIDEQTALAIDLDAGTAAVSGRGGVTVRGRMETRRIGSGETVPLDALRPDGRGPDSAEPAAAASAPRVDAGDVLGGFRAALAEGDVERAAGLALGVAAGAGPGAADLLPMIAALADAAALETPTDPRLIADPFVRALLDVRAAVRADKRWDLSDLIRDRLAAAGVAVKDTPDGPAWDFA